MDLLLVCILWTWGLTPLWVNILGTCLVGVSWMVKVAELIAEYANKYN